MLTGVQVLLDYDLAPKREVFEEVSMSDACALCTAGPLSPNASYADTLYWLEHRYPDTAATMKRLYDQEMSEIEASMGCGRSGGAQDAPISWIAVRKTFAHDSRLFPGYALSTVTLQIAMAQMHVEQQETLCDRFLVALCDICVENDGAGERPGTLLLRSYVNQWAGGNASVARIQPDWAMLAGIADFINACSPESYGSNGS